MKARKFTLLLLLLCNILAFAGSAPCHEWIIVGSDDDDIPTETWYGTYSQSKFGIEQYSGSITFWYRKDNTKRCDVDVLSSGLWHTMKYMDSVYNSANQLIHRYKCSCENMFIVFDDSDDPGVQWWYNMKNYNSYFKQDEWIVFQYRKNR